MPDHFVELPRVPTKRMKQAACQAMRKRQEAMGDTWFPVSNSVKAEIRYAAMIEAWEAEQVERYPQASNLDPSHE